MALQTSYVKPQEKNKLLKEFFLSSFLLFVRSINNKNESVKFMVNFFYFFARERHCTTLAAAELMA